MAFIYFIQFSKMLSVIIPIHNGEKYIPDLVSHLKEVTYKNFEAIFIDNNSTDKSVLVLQEALKDVPFSSKILSEEKQGAGSARNTGIKNANGTYLAFLDCDDKVHLSKWEEDISIFESHNVDFVFCRTQKNYDDGRVVYNPIDGFIEGVNNPPGLGYIWLKHYFYLQGTGAIMIKKEIVEQLGGFHSIKTGEDAFLFIRLGLKYTGYFYNKIYFFYTRHSKSTTSNTNTIQDGTLWSYFNLRKNLYNDAVVKNDLEAFKTVRKQLNYDALLLHRSGNSLNETLNDKLLKDFKVDFLLFNPISLFFNRLFTKNKYNPFLQVWKRIN